MFEWSIAVKTRFRLPINSTVDIASIFNRQLSNTSVLSLGEGAPSGYIDVIHLSNIKLFSINVNQPLAIYADRTSGTLLFSINLAKSSESNYIKAQGVELTRTALFGFNYNLKDLDLFLPSGSKMCCIGISADWFHRKLDQLRISSAHDLLDRFNVLANSLVSQKLTQLLNQCWDSSLISSQDYLEDEIISLLFECLVDRSDRKVARPIKRQDRHEAALKILGTAYAMPTKAFEIQDLSDMLHQSRTSLFNGCRDKFGMSPIQVVRSVRLHQVHHALLDVEFCIKHNISGVVDAAEFFGFVGRSHFSKHYKYEFNETPRQTLSRRRKAERVF